jgi:hypothetical protein
MRFICGMPDRVVALRESRFKQLPHEEATSRLRPTKV